MTAGVRGKAVVAMSGGVDSSVAAALLVEEGYEVTGIMLKLWKGETANHNSGCCSLGAAEDARRVADSLGIRFYVLNFAERFSDTVVRDFHNDYAIGRTPNPCVRCNQWIKFEALLERAIALGADVLATGHYARVRRARGRYRLLRGVDDSKDQSYVLWMLGQDELSRLRLPVGELRKSETREIAADLGLRTAAKPDSQEICFVKDGDLAAHLSETLPEASTPGPILDGSSNIVGQHRGVARYTVGQRKGLGISVGKPLFVTRIDASSNSVMVGNRRDLQVRAFEVEETSFVHDVAKQSGSLLVQHRAHGEVNEARARRIDEHRLQVAFEKPVEAVAPGQSAAFYSPTDPAELLGGGIISSTASATAFD